MDTYTNGSLLFKRVFSKETPGAFLEDFLAVSSAVFGKNSMMSSDYFKRKFIDNIYGESILVTVYSDGIPVATRAFWRNDLFGRKAYQPCNTAVIKDFRGKGIFKEMTLFALEKTEKKDLIYNYPNSNSYPQYLKLGWKNFASYRTVILTSFKKFLDVHSYVIDNDYLKWWILPQKQKFFVYQKNGFSFLVKKRAKNVYFIKGVINNDQAPNFIQLNSIFPIFLYYGKEVNFYNSRLTPFNIVIKTDDSFSDISIPTYKNDVI